MRDQAEAPERFLVSQIIQKQRRNTMNTVTLAILLVVAAVLLVALIVVPGIRAIIYAHSDEWKLQQRMRRILQHEAD
jgi:uncharacterized protein HemY